jgi:hypothetical protein
MKKIKKKPTTNKKNRSDKYVCFNNYLPLSEEQWDLFMPKETKNYILDPESFGGSDLGPIATPEQEQAIKDLGDIPDLSQFNLSPINTPEIVQALKDNYNMLDEKILEKKGKEAWIQTYTGKKFFPLNPRIEDICIQDIAHALSMQCRFTGHCKKFYSVAQHSVLVSYLCNEQDRKHGLLHDGSEYALGDVSSPLKRSGRFEEYKKMEKVLQAAIYRVFDLSEAEPPSVKAADLLMLGIEAQTLLEPKHPDWKYPVIPPPLAVIPLSPEQAETLFLQRFNELFDIE